jgi:lipopolysaccharide transport system permease protein
MSKPTSGTSIADTGNNWSIVIKPKSNWFNIPIHDIWQYRDLLMEFVHRDFVAIYKQTILGPLWFIIQPVLTTITFVLVFGKVAKLPTGDAPPILFYMSALIIWNYFSSCLNKTSVTFTSNAKIFGKVYFPRLVAPISIVIINLLQFLIQFAVIVPIMVYYGMVGYNSKEVVYHFSYVTALLPYIMIMVGFLALGVGLIISSLTVRYRDLVFLITFAIQLLMYGTPVIYSVGTVSEKYKFWILANPVSGFVETFRFGLIGTGVFNPNYLVYSSVSTIGLLLIGVFMFNKAEKTFMDVI